MEPGKTVGARSSQSTFAGRMIQPDFRGTDGETEAQRGGRVTSGHPDHQGGEQTEGPQGCVQFRTQKRALVSRPPAPLPLLSTFAPIASPCSGPCKACQDCQPHPGSLRASQFVLDSAGTLGKSCLFWGPQFPICTEGSWARPLGRQSSAALTSQLLSLLQVSRSPCPPSTTGPGKTSQFPPDPGIRLQGLQQTAQPAFTASFPKDSGHNP